MQIATFRRYSRTCATKCGRVLARYFRMRSLATVIPGHLSLLRLLLGFTAELDELLSFCTLFFIVLFRRIGIASRRLECSPEFFVVCLESQG